MNHDQNEKINHAWRQLQEQNQLDEKQLSQLKQYLQLLLEWNEDVNLTAIVQPYQIILDHFMDSLALTPAIDMNSVHMIADIGSGAGFPGIPLKIKYPDLHVVLIEVTGKKIAFLRAVIEKLALEKIELYTLDWRTFVRKTEYPVDVFVSRASLSLEELMRIYKPSSLYKQSRLVYWASKQWIPTNEEIPFIKDEFAYEIGNKRRKLIIFEHQVQ